MDLPTIVLGSVFIAAASFLRGLTGFGFGIVASPLLALVLPPAIAVPIVAILQIPSGLQTGLRDWNDTDVRAAAIAWIAATPTIALGLYAVSQISPDTMRIILGALVALSTAVLSVGIRLRRAPNIIEFIFAGALSGVMQGAVAMAGPPLILLLLSSNWRPERCRATLSFIFLLMGATTLFIGLWRGVVSEQVLLLSLIFLPGLAIGQVAGGRLFRKMGGRRYRRISIATVSATALAVIVRAMAGHWGD